MPEMMVAVLTCITINFTEVMQPDEGRVASDYFSFGVVLYELLCSTSLSAMHPEGITSHTILRTPEHLSDEAKHLLQQVSPVYNDDKIFSILM